MEPILKHYGILGMRWGVRRYRGSDGKIIPNKYMSSAKAAQLRKKGGSTPTIPSNNSKTSNSSNSKPSIKGMTTSELKEAVERLNLEKQYKQLTTKEVSTGMKFVNSVLSTSGKKAATTLTTKYMIKGGDTVIQELLKSLGSKK